MNKEIDARGMQCPLPVIETKKAIEIIDKGTITTIVDNEAAKENVSKLAKSMDLKVDIKQSDGDYYIDIFKEGRIESVDLGALNVQCNIDNDGNFVILITKNKLGEGSDELGTILMSSYLYALTESTPYPTSLIFLNGGVKLTVEDSSVLEHIRELESNGVEILSCGACLDYFKLKDKLAVGSVSNMYTIVEKLNSASNTITL